MGGACARGAKARPGWVGLAPKARGSASPPGSEKPDSRYPARDGGAGRHWPPQTQCVLAESRLPELTVILLERNSQGRECVESPEGVSVVPEEG